MLIRGCRQHGVRWLFAVPAGDGLPHQVAIVSGPVWTEPAPLERSNGRPPIGLAAPLSDAARTGRE